jgi:hypothetical protein
MTADPITIAQRGFAVWAAKPHNAKWFKRIDGTPIPNDLCVCIADAFREAPAATEAENLGDKDQALPAVAGRAPPTREDVGRVVKAFVSHIEGAMMQDRYHAKELMTNRAVASCVDALLDLTKRIAASTPPAGHVEPSREAIAPSTDDRLVQMLRSAAPCLDPPWMSRAVSQAADRLERVKSEPDYYPSHEALHDLVSLLSEKDALNGGGPGWTERWKKAVLNAEDIVRVEP